MKTINFLITNLSDILLIFSLATAVIYSLFTNSLSYLKDEIFSVLTETEKIYGSKTGEVKLLYAVEKIHSKMPQILRVLLSEERLKKIIENSLKKAKELWSRNESILTKGESSCQ